MTLSYSETRGIITIIEDWTSDGSGDSTIETKALAGEILGVTTDPAAGGDAPTLSYDLVVTNSAGADLLNGGGADRQAAITEHIVPSFVGIGANTDFRPCFDGKLTITVSNAGDTKSGQVAILVRPR